MAAVPRRRLPPGAGPARALLRRSDLGHGRRDRRADRRRRPGRDACRALGGGAGERRPGATPARVQRRRRGRQPARPQADVARRRRLFGRDPLGRRSRPLLARGRARLDGRAPARPERRAPSAATASGPGRPDRPLGRRQRLAGAPQPGLLAGAARGARGGLRASAGGATCGPPALAGGGHRRGRRDRRRRPGRRAARRQRGSPRAARAQRGALGRGLRRVVSGPLGDLRRQRGPGARGARVAGPVRGRRTARPPGARRRARVAGRLPRGRGPAHQRAGARPAGRRPAARLRARPRLRVAGCRPPS